MARGSFCATRPTRHTRRTVADTALRSTRGRAVGPVDCDGHPARVKWPAVREGKPPRQTRCLRPTGVFAGTNRQLACACLCGTAGCAGSCRDSLQTRRLPTGLQGGSALLMSVAPIRVPMWRQSREPSP